MSLFGSLMGDFEEDPIFGQMNSVVNSFFGGDPFGGLLGGMGGMGGMGMQPFGRMMPPHHNALMPFGFPQMPTMNMGRPGGFMQSMMPVPSSSSFTSTSFVSMSSGPDGRPQIYQASSSTKTGPNGVMETKKTVQDSRTGVKKMAIGHHIYDRGHIIEREQNLHEGTEEERQDFINLEEDEAEEFNREFQSKAGTSRRGGPSIQCIETGPLGRNQMPAIMPAQAQPSARLVEVEDETEDDNGAATEPIIELPESPSPPPVEEDQDDDKEDGVGNNTSGRTEDSSVGVGSSSSTILSPNPLGVQPRKPIRTHQSSPLATTSRPGHSMKSSSGGAHPYNAQQSRKPQHHRPMKGIVQYHNNSNNNNHNSYHQNPQYERDGN